MDKFKSLESIIKEMNTNRNTELRKKVTNVARPDTAADPTDVKSKIAKQGEIKTKIIDEAEDKDTSDKVADKNKSTPKKDTKSDESHMDDPKKIKGGKTEVDVEPVTDDKLSDESSETKEADKARKKANKEIGQKTASVKEEIEEAIGDHAALAKYADEHGRLDTDDLHTAAKHMKDHNMGALRRHLQDMDTDPRDKALEYVKKKHYAKLGYTAEEVEQVDELSKKTLGSYVNKAVANKGMNDRYSAGKPAGDKESDKVASQRAAGIKMAVKRLAKEEVETDVPFAGPYDKKTDAKDKNVAKNAARKSMKQMIKKVTKEAAELAGHEVKPYEGPEHTVGPDGKPAIRSRTLKAVRDSISKSKHVKLN
jgi:hypothetical protein